MNEGWVCPKCGAVMAPAMPNCVNDHTTKLVTTTYPPAATGGTELAIGQCGVCFGPFAVCRGQHTFSMASLT